MLETIFYIVLVAYTVPGVQLSSVWTTPFANEVECQYYLDNEVPKHELPFPTNEEGKLIVVYEDVEYEVEFWAHSCEEHYYDAENNVFRVLPGSI